jgi:hypothetical protein
MVKAPSSLRQRESFSQRSHVFSSIPERSSRLRTLDSVPPAAER